MKRILSLLLLGLLWTGASSARAQESVEREMELLRQLTNKKWYDLAKVKIEQLQKRDDPQLKALLPLELAYIDLAIASQQDVTQRFAVYERVRTELEKSAQQSAGKLQGAYASMVLARVDLAYGQALLMQAMRKPDNKSRHAQARPAEKRLIQAGEDYQKAIKAVELALQDPANAKFSANLGAALQQLKLESAMLLFYQARTYIDRANFDVIAARAALMSKTIKAFEALEQSERNTATGFLATAWLMKCSMETNQPINTAKYYNAIITAQSYNTINKLNVRGIQDAYLLVEYFWMQDKTLKRDAEENETETIGTNPDNDKFSALDRLKMVKAKGHDLEKKYPNLLQTEVGQGILFELAYAYLWEGRYSKDPKAAEPLMVKAEQYFKKVATKNSEVADRAGSISGQMEYQRISAGSGELKSFDDFFVKAMTERRKVLEVNGKLEQLNPEKDKDKIKSLEAERKKTLTTVIRTLNTALALAPPKKLDEVHSLLSGAYLFGGDPFRGVIVAEAWGRSRSPRAAEGVASALQTYSSLQSRFPNNPTLRKRLEDLAHFALSEENQVLWKNDPVTGVAHYHLAMSADREGKTREAIKHLEVLPPSFIDYAYTQGQIVFMALKASEKTLKKEEKQEYAKLALAAIDRMPKLNLAKDSPSVVRMYFLAKLEKAKFLYSEAMEELNAKEELKAVKKCNEMAGYVRGLQTEFKDVSPTTLTKENHEQIQFTMGVMLKYGVLGVAEIRFRSDAKDRFQDVIKTTNTVVEDMLKQAAKTPAEEPIKLKDYGVTGDILGLALRAHVQQGEVARGKAILDVLKRLQDEEGRGGAGVVVSLLLKDIAKQVRTMTDAKDPALAATKSNYATFLEDIAKEFDSMLIGHAYVSLGMPCKAAQSFSKVKAPPSLDKDVKKIVPLPKESPDKKIQEQQEIEFKKMMAERDKWEAEVRRYWGAQIEYIRALRACKEKGSFATVNKLVAELIAHKNARFQVQAMVERNLFLEDEAMYREAYSEWSKFLAMPALKNKANPEVKTLYFTAYFYTIRTLYKTSIHDKKLKDPQRLLTGAADMIVKLEFPITPKYKFTDQSAVVLRSKKVPEAVLSKLLPLKEKEYEKEPFLKALAGVLPKSDLDRDRDTLLTYTLVQNEGWLIVEPLIYPLLKEEPRLREEYEKLKKIRKALQ